MATNRRLRRRTAVLASAAVSASLAVGLLTGCEFGESPACLSGADAIADSIAAIHRAGADAIEDPTRTEESVETMERNLDSIDDKSDDSEVGKAVDNLNQAIEDYNQAILNGDTPDSAAIDKAADALEDVCTS